MFIIINIVLQRSTAKENYVDVKTNYAFIVQMKFLRHLRQDATWYKIPDVKILLFLVHLHVVASQLTI